MMRIALGKIIYYFLTGIFVLTNLVFSQHSIAGAINGYASGWCGFADEFDTQGTYFLGRSHQEVVKKCKDRATYVKSNGWTQIMELTGILSQTAQYLRTPPGFQRTGLATSWAYKMTSISPEGGVYEMNGDLGVIEKFCKPDRGAHPNSNGTVTCHRKSCPEGEEWDPMIFQCGSNGKQSPACPSGGTNPINVLTGNKHAKETDVLEVGQSIDFRRYYNSAYDYSHDTAFGTYWRHEYERRVRTNLSGTIATVQHARGDMDRFAKLNNVWLPEADGTTTLVELVDNVGDRTGWEYTTEDNRIEVYNALGVLQSITPIDGNTLTFVYNLPKHQGGDGSTYTLDRITNKYGISLQFKYQDFILVEMIDALVQSYKYEYNANGMLVSVTYPDETPSDPNDNPKRIYHYEDTRFTSALTGITDENGNRFATWSYDAKGRATSSQHVGITELKTIDYTYVDDPIDPRVTVSNELGKDTTYHYNTVIGVRKTTQVEGHASANCAAANQNYTYDAKGFLASKADWNGNQTTYVRDARGLELSRTEAVGTPQARTITTEWHPQFRLPVKVTEQNKIAEYTYDTQGQLLSRRESSAP